MPSEGNKILKYNRGEKSLKAPFMIYTSLECLLEKMHPCQNNIEKKAGYICKKESSIDKNNENAFKIYDKVRDHCHYTGKFRGAAHSIYNLRYKTPKDIPVIFHNGSIHDYHFIINQLEK